MEFPLPELGEGVYEAELVRWLVQPGSQVSPGQDLLQVLTDKATMDVPAPFHGRIEKLRIQPGAKVRIGDILLDYESTSPISTIQMPQSTAPTTSTVKGADAPMPKRTDNGAIAPPAAPSVRFMARKLGIDLKQVRGSGPGGRILIDDLAKVMQDKPAPKRSAKKLQDQIELGKPGSRIALTGVRRAISEHMIAATRDIPHYSYMDECEVTELVRLRDGLREPLSQRNIKLTYLAFFIKATANALREVPLANSTLDLAAGEIILHDRYHIGFAVTTARGLIVPVIHDVNKKDVFAIAREIEQLSEAARTGSIKVDSLRGGTFTVTSIGAIGGLIATPIIHAPQVGILGLGKVIRRPVYDDAGNLRPADLIYLSLSFDHRVVDGAVGAMFGNSLIRQMRHPAALMLPEVG